MEHHSLDPYEQQLLKVFDSYDLENCGSLDEEGLTQLCHSLQLEEQGTELIQHLLSSSKNPRVTFTEFKDGLLTLLGNVQNSRTQINDNQVTKDNDKGSPDREVSPKFVYGSKKYGRRSRPRIDEAINVEEQNENLNYINKGMHNNVSVQRSNSQSDVLYTKKRKTNTKLKRCTSFPGNHDYDNQRTSETSFVTNGFNNEQDFICTEDMLREAWKKLGVGESGFLNQTELVLVCDSIGLHKLANGVLRQLSSKLELDYDSKISFQELLEALQQDDTWSDVLNPVPTSNRNSDEISCLADDSVFPNPKLIQHITLGPDGTGFIASEVIIEMWENAGITTPKLLLQDLGFSNSQINVSELAVILEKEIKSMNDSRSEYSNPHIVLLQAILSLYQSEIRCMKNILEQMHAEREKLKFDVSEANNRATLLAQEVDDNHARMELNTQNQVKLLEQRHADVIKEVTEQYTNEKEQMSQLNQNLEQKIYYLEAEEAKLRNDLLSAQKYSFSLEKENTSLTNQISNLQQVEEVLNEQLSLLENEKQKCAEYEKEHLQMEPLLAKLSVLQVENAKLRDKNDEMLSEIESLSNQISAMRSKTNSTPTFHNLEQSMEENISIICEGVGLGSKRRNDDSPSKDINSLCLGDGSPRLGKVRKCHKNKTTEYLDIPVTSSESGIDTELECLDSSLSISVNDNEEIVRLQGKIALLEQILRQHSIPLPTNNQPENDVSSESELHQLKQRCEELENMLVGIKIDVNKMIDDKRHFCDCASTKVTRHISQKLNNMTLEGQSLNGIFDAECCGSKQFVDASTETEKSDINVEESIEKYVEANKQLDAKCLELQSCVELLRNEYERCEDYWASKLNDERQMFEQENAQNSEKLAELIGKMTEYEAQFAAQEEVDYRLPPIEEKYNLEKQFTDLEQEYEEYKEQAEFQIAEKDQEISSLRQMVEELSLNHKRTSDMAVQVDLITENSYVSLENKLSNLSNCVIESTNLFSADTMPFGWSTAQPAPSEHNSTDIPVTYNESQLQRDYVNPTFVWNRDAQTPSTTSKNSVISNQEDDFRKMSSLMQCEVSTNQPYSIISIPSTSAESTSTTTTDNTNNAPCRPKRTRKHDKNYKTQRPNKKDDLEKNLNNHSFINNATHANWKNIQNERLNPMEQTVALPLSAVHNLNGRLHHLEQRCRHLQVVLKQQHYHAEQLLQHYWTQHRGEKAELQYLLKSNQEKLDYQLRICNEQLERLARTDMLVKDLYVENSYLLANVQRLEKQCHMLSQCNSSSSSV